MRMLEEVVIRVCYDFGIPAQRISGRTGVWTLPYAEGSTSGTDQEKKISAMGIHVSQGVTSHGFALNVTTDLRGFDLIVPCGITDRTVTSLELEAQPTDDPSRQPTMENAINSTARAFSRVFNRQIVAANSLDELLAAKAQG
jgi:lipoyl(octanoyl) transferase